MKMILTENGWVQKRERNIIEEMRHTFPLSTAYIVDTPSIKESIKNMDFLKGGKGRKAYSIAMPTLVLGMATGGSGVFWDAFMTYIFPWMLDIAKVFCAIKIAQAFYQERRGGRDEGTGFGALVTYGKWYLVFWLIPWGVELIDQIGGKMLNELRQGASMN
jgi:hypothetical protein